jgi:Helix-turn-helix
MLCAVGWISSRILTAVEELGVSEQILSNWLSGSRVPLLKNLFKIEEFLKKQKSRRK